MSKSYASEKDALGTCDRCGWTYPLKDLRFETVNLVLTSTRVCPDCWDPDHPQLRVGDINYDDPQALENARPDSARAGLLGLSAWDPIASLLITSSTGIISVR